MGIQPCWAFFDCFAGISGDMTLGALIDLGLPVEELQGLLPALGLAEVSLTARRVTKEHLTGIKVEIEAGARQPPRTYREICALIEAAPLTEGVKTRSLTMFRLLGEVEARIHGQPLETVHFHELGALDTIVDVVGVAFGLEQTGNLPGLLQPPAHGVGDDRRGPRAAPQPGPRHPGALKRPAGLRHRPAGGAGHPHRRRHPQGLRGEV